MSVGGLGTVCIVDLGLGVAKGRAALHGLRQQGSAKVILLPGPEVVFLNTAGGLTGGDRMRYGLELAAGLRAAASTLANTPEGGIALRFDAVAFEQLMPWLDRIEREAGYALAGLRLAALETPGMVLAEIRLDPRQ